MKPIEPWPDDGIERVAACPLCSATQRRSLYTGLRDKVFGVAQGEWNLWSCSGCGCAYLDARPNEATISLAYLDYYTHRAGSGRVPYTQLGWLRRCLRQLNHGYVNWRYGRNESPACALGIPAAYLALPLKVLVDAEHRHLPRPTAHGARLLDLGCGDGSFLVRARNCGWTAYGADPDPSAAAHLKGQGIEVRLGGIEQFAGEQESFDAITLSHVIEHLHDPLHVLRQCHALLRPGGLLWIETPNIESLGHKIYKECWRDIDAPRHLVLFSPQSLRRALREAGFSAPRVLARPSPTVELFWQSNLIRRGLLPFNSGPTPLRGRYLAMLCTLFTILAPDYREYLTLKVTKSS